MELVVKKNKTKKTTKQKIKGLFSFALSRLKKKKPEKNADVEHALFFAESNHKRSQNIQEIPLELEKKEEELQKM